MILPKLCESVKDKDGWQQELECSRLFAEHYWPQERALGTALQTPKPRLSQYTSFSNNTCAHIWWGFVHVMLDVDSMCRLLSKPDQAWGIRSFCLLFKSNCIS